MKHFIIYTCFLLYVLFDIKSTNTHIKKLENKQVKIEKLEESLLNCGEYNAKVEKNFKKRIYDAIMLDRSSRILAAEDKRNLK